MTTKVSELPDGGTVESTDDIPVVRSGSTMRTRPGTAASHDTGTASDEVPTNADADSRGFAQQVGSVSDLRSGSFPDSLQRIWLAGYYGVGTAGGGPLYRDPDDTTTDDNGGTVFVDSDNVRWKAESGFQVAEDFNVNVPSDFSDLQSAVDRISEMIMLAGVMATVNIETGTVIESGLKVEDSSDASNIRITSDDATVTVGGSIEESSVINVDRYSRGPVLDCVIDVSGNCGFGYRVNEQSVGYATDSASMKNAINDNVFCNRQSDFNVEGGLNDAIGDYSGAGRTGIWADHNCRVHARRVNLNGCEHSVWAQSNSVVDIGSGSTANDANGIAILSQSSSRVYAGGVEIKNCNGAFAVQADGGYIDLGSATIEDASGRGVDIRDGGYGRLRDITIRRSGGRSISLSRALPVEATDCVIEDSGEEAVLVDRSQCNVSGATISGTSAGYDDLRIARGSIIHAALVSSPSMNVTPNSISSDGIIFN